MMSIATMSIDHNSDKRFALFTWSSYPVFSVVGLGDLDKLLTKDLGSVGADVRGQMWTTFCLVYQLAHEVDLIETDRLIKNPEKSTPEKERKISEMVRGRGASAYLKIVDQILDVLEKQLVSYEDLAAIVCEGNLQRACSTCDKEVTIRAVSAGGMKIKRTPSVLFRPTSSGVFSCGHSECLQSPEECSWVAAVAATWHKLRETKCDNCFLLAPAQDVHR